MWKKNLTLVRDYVIKHSKVAFPVLVIAAVAVTVSIAMGSLRNSQIKDDLVSEEETVSGDEETLPTEDVAMEANTDQVVNDLIHSYYSACVSGDSDALLSVCDKLSDQELLRLTELSKFIVDYPVIEIYTKPGPEEGSVIAYTYYKVLFENHEEQIPGIVGHYLCKDENGKLYIKRSDVSEDINEYIDTVSKQEDVEELKNKVKVEYNELMTAHPELLDYLSELDKQVDSTVGIALAEMNASQEAEETPEETGETTEEGGETTEEVPVENTVLYAEATTTVNVRASDSEKADKLGKVTGGTQLQILEQKENGWTKILFENKEGFIKSEYLSLVDSAEGQEVIGTVSATTNVNVRAQASETADRLGVLAGGEKVELLARENGWCKIKYSGRVGYVKEDFVE